MEPQPPYPNYTPPNNPYGFIMEPPKKPRRSLLKIGGISNNPFLMKIILILGGVTVLMIISAIAINIFFGDKTNVNDIVAITQTENEISRVASQGTRATSIPLKNSAITTQLTISTQQQAWINFLSNHGRKVSAKELTLKKSADTDTELTQARATSTYDTVFSQILKGQLESYAAILKDAYSNTSNAQEKNLLNEHYKQTQLLLEQLLKGA